MKQQITDVTFPGKKRVYATLAGRTIETDQDVDSGGDGSAPEPFDLFLASLATCAGIYALGFCQQRELPIEGLALRMISTPDASGRRLERLTFELTLPEGFPAKYVKPIGRAVELCTVKKHLHDPPSFEVVTKV